MKFKNWLLTEELYLQNNTAVVYHRTTDLGTVSSLISQIFEAGKAGGCALGCGLYTMVNIESQFTSHAEDYGRYITKWKISGLENFLVLSKNEAMKIHGPDYLVSSQLKKLNVLDSWKQAAGSDWQEKLNDYDKQMSDSFLGNYKDWCEKNLKGAIYMDMGLFGPRFGLCILKYPPVEDGVTFLGYAESDNYNLDPSTINNLEWKNTMKGTSVKSLYQAKVSGRDISDKVIKAPPLVMTPIDFANEPRAFKLSPTRFVSDSITLKWPGELRSAIIRPNNPPITFTYLDEKQWYAAVKTKENIFTLNGKQITPNTQVPINAGDKLCVQTKGSNYCLLVGGASQQIKSYVLGKINLDLVGRELIFHGSRGDHKLTLNPQQMQQLTGIKAEATETPIFGTAPPRIDWSKKGREVVAKYFNVNKQLANGSETVKLTGNTITVDDKPLIQLTQEQTHELTLALNDMMQYTK